MLAKMLLLLAAVSQVSEAPTPLPTDGEGLTASIRAMNDQPVPSETEGLLRVLNVKHGSRVKKDDVLAMVDDQRAQAQVEVTNTSWVAADERAKDRVEEQYARLVAELSKKDHEISAKANVESIRATGSPVIPFIEMEKKKLDWDRAVLQIEKALKDQRLARLEADVKFAEWKAAEAELKRRTIVAPFDGEVQELMVHQAEWVNPGDPILQLVQFDTMWVECWVSADMYNPAELQDRPVTVRVSLARNARATVTGKIVWVSQTLLESSEPNDYTSQFFVRAEVKNRRDGDFWLIRPGMPAKMTIHVDQPRIAVDDTVGQRTRVEQP